MDQLLTDDGGAAVPVRIPNKLFFKIGEVSQLVGVEAHVLRYWEEEFRELAPKKSSTGQRMFRRKDVEVLLRIKDLLYEKKFTIEGARKSLAASRAESVRKSTVPKRVERQTEMFGAPDPLVGIRAEVVEILKLMG